MKKRKLYEKIKTFMKIDYWSEIEIGLEMMPLVHINLSIHMAHLSHPYLYSKGNSIIMLVKPSDESKIKFGLL